MYCSNCGKKISENEEICPFCNFEIKSEEKYNKELQMEKQIEIKLKEEDKKLLKKCITISLICVVIATLITIYSVLNINKTENNISVLLFLITMIFAVIGNAPYWFLFRSNDRTKYYSHIFLYKLLISGLLYSCAAINIIILFIHIITS